MQQVLRVYACKLTVLLTCVIGSLVLTDKAMAQDHKVAPKEPAEGVHMHEHARPFRESEPTVITQVIRSPDDFNKPWLKWEHMTGDWGGARPWLDDHGITLEMGYTADFFYNMRGGLNTSDADQYRGVLGIGLTIDTERMNLWDGGTFFLGFQQIHGTDITERHVGDLQALNNNDAPDRTQLAEFWYEHSLFDGKWRIKLGKMDANADFCYVDYGAEFINSSAGINPIIPMPQYPDPSLGIATFIEPIDWFYLAAGVYDGEYDAMGTGERTGFDTAFHGRDDSFTVVELGLRPTLTIANQELPGAYRVGGWYQSSIWDVYFDDLDGRRLPRSHRGNAGVYLNFDQMFYRENPEVEDDEQGLGAFFQFAWAPSAYNEIGQYYGFGGRYVGLIPSRDDDITGFGVFHAGLSGRVQSLESRHSETAIELFHKFQLTEFMSIKPDAQYIVNPGGDGRDAIAAGLRFEFTF